MTEPGTPKHMVLNERLLKDVSSAKCIPNQTKPCASLESSTLVGRVDERVDREYKEQSIT